MKKYALLLLMVLVLSTTAWAGFTSLSLTIQASNKTATGTFHFVGPEDARICIDPIDGPRDRCFSVKIYVDCDNCGCGGTKSFTTPITFPSKLCPGSRYTACVEVYCRGHKCCQTGGSRRIAKLTSSFSISGKGSSSSSSSSRSFWSSFMQSSRLF